MVILTTEKFRFMRDDVFLCPYVNSESGDQTVVMQKINLKTGKIEFEDRFNPSFDGYFGKYKTNNQINLTPNGKFIALKSWTASIAESGIPFKIQGGIESIISPSYLISSYLLRFWVKVDPDFFHGYFEDLKQVCMNESSFISNLIPFIKFICLGAFVNRRNYQPKNISNIEKVIIDAIYKVEISYKAFQDNQKFLSLIAKVDPEYLKSYFDRMLKDYNAQIQKDESSFVKNLNHFIDIIYSFSFSSSGFSSKNIFVNFSNTIKDMLTAIFNLKESFNLLKGNFKYLRLITHLDLAYFREHLKKVENECRSHNEVDIKKFTTYLENFINSYYKDVFADCDECDLKISDIDKNIIKTIFEFIESNKIFIANPNFLTLLSCVNPDYILAHLKSIRAVLINQSKQWEDKFIAILIPTIYNIEENCFSDESPYGNISISNEAILKVIDTFEISHKLFKKYSAYTRLITYLDRDHLP